MAQTEKLERKTLQGRQPVTLPKRFEPRFWEDADQRHSIVRIIKRRYHALKLDVGADSLQKDLLVQRAAFISTILETQEVVAAEGGGLDLGSYVQAANALSGLLIRLGLEKRIKNVNDLRTYLDQKRK